MHPCVCGYVCVFVLLNPAVPFHPEVRGQQSNQSQLPSVPPPRHVRCVCLFMCVCFCPYSYPFLKVSMTVCVCLWWRVYDCLNLCVCALPCPPARVAPAVGRDPSSKSRECSRCLDRQNTPATSEATRRCLESHPETDASLSSPRRQNKPATRLIYAFTFLFHIALRRNWISTSRREFI